MGVILLVYAYGYGDGGTGHLHYRIDDAAVVFSVSIGCEDVKSVADLVECFCIHNNYLFLLCAGKAAHKVFQPQINLYRA